MRNKASLIPIVLIALVGIVFASGIYFPDSNPSLPRLPAGPGTIGGVLQNLFAPDGTATNTEKLGGITATGYLHSGDCTDPINRRWIGVDANGKGVCGLGTPIIGKFDTVSPGVQVMKYGTSTWIAANTTDDLYPGDKIATNGGTATIDFALDASILRLDTNTTVELHLGNLDGNSVAEAILSDGRLWGRILTSTGVNLGVGGVVAGVRGTSVSIEKNALGYNMAIIDSQKPTNAGTSAPRFASTDPVIGTTIVANSSSIITANSKYEYMSPSPTPNPGSLDGHPEATVINYPTPSIITFDEMPREDLIRWSAWIRENTKLDIDYLYANSGAETIIRNEYNVTLPLDISADVLTALCTITSDDPQIYWKSLVGTTYTDKCRSSSLVAFAEYGSGNLSLYFSGQVMTASGDSTNNITGTGKYLGYSIPSPLVSYFSGKTLKIELNNTPIRCTNTHNKCYIVQFGSESYFIQKNSDCSNQPKTGLSFCKKYGGGSSVEMNSIYNIDSNTITLMIPSVFTSFLIGNANTSPTSGFYLDNSIKAISIE